MIDQNQPYLDIDIQGFKRILPPDGKISMYRADDMVMAVYGGPGSGKTILSLQMAFGIAAKNSKAILYLTKDTSPQSMLQKSIVKFNSFGHFEFTDLKGLGNKEAWNNYVGSDCETKDDSLNYPDRLPKKLPESYANSLIDYLENAQIENKKFSDFIKSRNIKTHKIEDPRLELKKIADKIFPSENERNYDDNLRAAGFPAIPHCNFLLGNNLTGFLQMKVKDQPEEKYVIVENLSSQFAKIKGFVESITQKNISESFKECYKYLDSEFRLLLVEEICRRFGEKEQLDVIKIIQDNRPEENRTLEKWKNSEKRTFDKLKEYLKQSKGEVKDKNKDEDKDIESIDFYVDKLLKGKPDIVSIINFKTLFNDVLSSNILDPRGGSSIAFADLAPGAVVGAHLNKYTDPDNEFVASPISSLIPLSTSLAPIFSWLRRDLNSNTTDKNEMQNHEKKANEKQKSELEKKIGGIRDLWNNQLMVVCDSVTPSVFEECIHIHHSSSVKPSVYSRGQTDQMNFTKPTWLFIVESEELPESATAAFAPDVQIQMKAETLPFNVCKRTIHIKKARHQIVENKPFQFIIKTADKPKSGKIVIPIRHDQLKRDFYSEYFSYAGIVVMPSVSQFLENSANNFDNNQECGKISFYNTNDSNELQNDVELPPNSECKPIEKSEPPPNNNRCFTNSDENKIYFGKGIDSELTTEANLVGGNCTLILSENRCHSTVFGLHFLVGSNPKKDSSLNAYNQVDTLFISLENDISRIIEYLRSFGKLNGYFREENSNILPSFTELDTPNKNLTGIDFRHSGIFYDIHICKSHFVVYAPIQEWKTIAEVLDDIVWVISTKKLNSEYNWNFKRILFSKVSGIHSTWPSIAHPKLLVFSIAQLCQQKKISFMIIDDTANQSSHTGHISSEYLSLASNVIRLKRVSIRGTQAVALEVIRALNREIKYFRPLELSRERCDENAFTELENEKIKWDLIIRDNFRGCSGIFSDNPKHCKIRLDLPYDRENSPLQAEVEQIQYNLGLLFDRNEIEVRALGPSRLHGINATLAHLANLTHETCHICAIDEIWLSSLLNSEEDSASNNEPALAVLRRDDLRRILPNNLIAEYCKVEKGSDITLGIASRLFVTKALTIVEGTIKIPEQKYPYAIPYYHNWGILTVYQPRQKIVNKLSELLLSPEITTEKTSERDKIIRLLKNYRELKSVKADIENLAIYNCLWENNNIAPSWNELCQFKTKVWDILFTEEYIDKIEKAIEKDKDGLKKIFPNGFNFRFFTMCSEGEEAIVCYFLELILSQGNINDLFTRQTDKPNTQLIFKSIGECTLIESIFTKTLVLMHNILCEEDRKKIALGKWNTRKENYGGSAENENLPASGTTYSSSITALFSREWTTSIPEFDFKNDWREKIELKHLPVWDKNEKKSMDALFNLIEQTTIPRPPDEKPTKKDTPLPENDNNSNNNIEWIVSALKDKCKNIGPTISGTWYLGVLRGGNKDLAADIISELTSEIRETERVRKLKAAGVYKSTYDKIISDDKKDIKNSSSYPNTFPYSEIIKLCYCGNDLVPDDNLMYVFPFCRMSVEKYTEVSIEIYDMIRRTMNFPGQIKNNDIVLIVKNSLNIINKIQNPIRGSNESK